MAEPIAYPEGLIRELFDLDRVLRRTLKNRPRREMDWIIAYTKARYRAAPWQHQTAIGALRDCPPHVNDAVQKTRALARNRETIWLGLYVSLVMQLYKHVSHLPPSPDEPPLDA